MLGWSDRNLQYLSGVGPQRAALLEKELSIKTFRDLLYYFPYKYIDRSRIYRIVELTPAMSYVQFRASILSFESFGSGRNLRVVAHVSDGTGVVDLVWFQGAKYATENLRIGKTYLVFGKPTLFNGHINVAHPEIADDGTIELGSMGLQPFYNTTERMKKGSLNSKTILKLIRTLLDQFLDSVEETLPEYMLNEFKMVSLQDALRMIHSPRNMDEIKKAQFRIKFEELFYIQLNILQYTYERREKQVGWPFVRVGDAFNDFYHNHLPFELTGAQKRVLKEIRRDLGSGRQMNRLLQGDVGSGKTMVAFMSSLLAVDNGFQACIMAPTEILARQHLETIERFLDGMQLNVDLLMGSVKGKKRKKILEDLQTGALNILIGTHALLEDNVQFKNLGLVIIDEQHRFGVAQRARLWTKNVQPPHVLVMTATPIPRTLAMTLYGDLDVSVIDELPPGRKPIHTIHEFDTHPSTYFGIMRRQMQEGRQVYVVYPLIKESEKIDLKNLEDGYQLIQEVFPDVQISVVHGKMRPEEKEAQMQRFLLGETRIMVATTVIEVGVNVPNATVMAIMDADRFGLAQLHQLRGRVGRGGEQSYCILVTGYKISEDTSKRLDIMCETTDGFEIAEADLKFRGPGDMDGTMQSGQPFHLRLADLAHDGQILQLARDVAERLIKSDKSCPDARNRVVWRELARLKDHDFSWSRIS